MTNATKTATPKIKAANSDPSMKHRAARDAALTTLRSADFFAILRGALRALGLTAKEEAMGLGAYFVSVSRFQSYPLRVQIEEPTQGTAAYIVRKVSALLPADNVVTIRPKNDEEWERFLQSPNQKVVFVPEWEEAAQADVARLYVRRDGVSRRIPAKEDGRVVEECAEVHGRFACLSVQRPWQWGRQPRWMCMREPSGPQTRGSSTLTPSSVKFDEWHEVQRHLEQRARVPIVLPDWEQLVMELMGEREEPKMHRIPALMQTWRTMTLIRSFQSVANDKATQLIATFEDLAEATLLAKRLFREGASLPSCKRIFNALEKPGNSTRVMNPLTGKPVVYQVVEQQESTIWEKLF